MSVVRSPVRSVVRSPVRGVLGGSASLADEATSYLNGVAPYHWFDFVNDRCLYASNDVGGVSGATGYSFSRASTGYYTNADGTLTLFGYNAVLQSADISNAYWNKLTGGAAASATTFNFTSTFGSGLESSGTLTAPAGALVTASGEFAGSGTIQLGVVDASGAFGSTYLTIVLTATPTRYSITRTLADANALIRVRNASGVSVTGATVTKLQLEQGSTATTYIPTTSAAAGALRRGNRGVLIEGARTNLLLRSQEFDNASWNKDSTTITANATTAPDGTTTADQCTEVIFLGGHTCNQAVTVTSATNYTLTAYFKKGPTSRDFAVIGTVGAGTGYSYFNLTTGVVGSKLAAHVSHRMTALAGGWYRCEVVVLTTTTSLTCYFGAAPTDGGAAYTGDTAYSQYVWQSDCQLGSFASSPIPTTTASATRAADVLTCTAGVSYPLRMFAEFERAVSTGVGEIIAQIDAGSDANRLGIYVTSIGRPQAFAASSGATQADITIASTIAINTTAKIAARCATNSVNLAYNGTAGTEDASVTVPSSPTLLRFGSGPAGFLPSFGYVRRLAVIQGAGTDADLTGMTS